MTKRFVKMENCGHVVHDLCIPAHHTCPMCRVKSFKRYPLFVETEAVQQNDKIKVMVDASTQTEESSTIAAVESAETQKTLA